MASVSPWLGQYIAVHHRGTKMQRICDSSSPIPNPHDTAKHARRMKNGFNLQNPIIAYGQRRPVAIWDYDPVQPNWLRSSGCRNASLNAYRKMHSEDTLLPIDAYDRSIEYSLRR